MSLTLKLILAFAAVFAISTGVLGYGAVRISGETVERGIVSRIDATLAAVRANPAFFIYEASSRQKELRQLADISGFEIVVPGAEGLAVASSLPEATALEFLTRVPAVDRFELTAGGVGYRASRARLKGRTFYLLCPSAPIDLAKRDARQPILWLAGIGLAISVALGAVVARTVTRPLSRLAERAGEVRGEQLAVEIPLGGGREVGSLALALRDMLGRVQRYREELLRKEKMATLGEFSAAVAHELRNPLSAMRMSMEMLKPKSAPEVAAELELLLSEMGRLDHSVEELLFYAGEPHYRREAVDLPSVVSEAARMLAPLARHLGVDLVVAASDPGARPIGDAARIRQAVVNLLLNGIRAAGPDGRVVVGVFREGGRVGVRVRDTGEGPPTELGTRIFEAFVTGHPGGTGLGLAVTSAIAKAHGGRVDWRRANDETEFLLVLGPGGE